MSELVSAMTAMLLHTSHLDICLLFIWSPDIVPGHSKLQSVSFSSTEVLAIVQCNVAFLGSLKHSSEAAVDLVLGDQSQHTYGVNDFSLRPLSRGGGGVPKL